MSIRGWACGLSAAVVMMTAAGMAAAEPADPRWVGLKDHAIVVEGQDGSLVAGTLVGVDEGSVVVSRADGSRVVVERGAIKALRARLRDKEVTVTTKEGAAPVSGKLAESDPTTIVVVTDDGRRVTMERASIASTLPRTPAAAAAPPLPAAIDGAAASDMANEAKPSKGTGLIVAGAVFMGIGVGVLSAIFQCSSNNNVPASAQSQCAQIVGGIGGGTAGAGLLLLTGGLVQHAQYAAWKRKHGTLGFVPAQGGGALTWQGTF